MRAIAALRILRNHAIRPVLAGLEATRLDPQPTLSHPSTDTTSASALDIQTVFDDLGIAA
jgi:hypothetical protein